MFTRETKNKYSYKLQKLYKNSRFGQVNKHQLENLIQSLQKYFESGKKNNIGKVGIMFGKSFKFDIYLTFHLLFDKLLITFLTIFIIILRLSH